MNYIKKGLLSLLPFAFLLMSCNDKNVSFNRIEYVIPDHIDVKTDDLNKAFGEVKSDPSSTMHIVVILYSYSSGAETMSISSGGDFKTSSSTGRLKALVKVMDGKKILRAEFAEGGGNSKEEMLSSLVKEIKLKLFN